MTRRMLINARHAAEVRVAVVDGPTLENYQVQVAEQGLTRGNIYRGRIANLQPALDAAFVDYGVGRHGFLAIQDVVPEAYYHPPERGKRPRIEQVLERGEPVVVQVSREPEGTKGAVLTTNLSLAGRYLVLTPFDATRGVSRKVEDEETRRALKQHAAGLEVPAGCGLIVRTNALDQNKAGLQRDLAALLRLWKQVENEARRGEGVRLLYDDQDLLRQALRDHLDAAIEEILVDDDEAFVRVEEVLHAYLPRGKARLERYRERMPLFARYGVEAQIEKIYDRVVPLPSGGSIVIDRTEAMTVVDVNSGKSTQAATQEASALRTDLEAAAEIARQLRLRDLGGLVVVDFIDLRSRKGRAQVEKALREAMKADRARAHVGRLSPNGLLEINRQRVQQALDLRTQRPCAVCGGTGRVPSPETVALQVLRRIEARAALDPLERVKLAVHPEVAQAFREARRAELEALERELDLRVEVVAAGRLRPAEQEIDWVLRPGGRAAVTVPSPADAADAAAPAAGRRPAAKKGRVRRPRGGRRRGRKRGGAATSASPPA
jgi:ribonuclease E